MVQHRCYTVLISTNEPCMTDECNECGDSHSGPEAHAELEAKAELAYDAHKEECELTDHASCDKEE